MKNSDHSNYTEVRIKKIGFIVICCVMAEIIGAGKRIAFCRELRSLKKLVDPLNIDLEEDTDLLRILKEPHVKLASTLADYIHAHVLEPYALVTLLDDENVLMDEWATETGYQFFWKFMFFRNHPRRRDRYINFNKVLLSAQRVTYEFLKLMITGKTTAFECNYRTNYSPGRLKALTVGNEDPIVSLLASLINTLNEYESESRELTLEPISFKKTR